MTPYRRVGAAILLAAVCSACGVPVDERARALDPEAAPYRVVTTDRATPRTGTHRIVVFLVRDDAVQPVARRIASAPTPEEVLRALAAGPSPQEQAQGYRSALSVDPDAAVARVAGSTVNVDLPATTEASNRSDAVLGFAQVVLSLTSLPNVTGVTFESDGQPLQVPRADGSLSTGPLLRVDYRELIDPT